jgi:hypothetical protein
MSPLMTLQSLKRAIAPLVMCAFRFHRLLVGWELTSGQNLAEFGRCYFSHEFCLFVDSVIVLLEVSA